MSPLLLLPDFQSQWQWPRQLNPHTDEIRQESQEWAAKFGAFSPRAQKSFDKCNFNLLTGLLYPWMNKEQLRCGNDLMNLFFIFDEHSDKSSPSEVEAQVAIIKDALHNPDKPRPEGEWLGGEVTRQFWARSCQVATSQIFKKRFIQNMSDYLDGTAEQAADRDRSHIRDVTSYFELRRKTIGVLSSFDMLLMNTEIPEEVFEHPVIVKLLSLAVDLTIIANDVLSYDKEQASGDDEHNLITIVMAAQGIDVQAAVNWAGDMHADMTRRFNQLFLEIPQYGDPIDRDLKAFMNGSAHWTGGNVQWSYESGRYFGTRGLEVMATRSLQLSPKLKGSNEIGPVIIGDSWLRRKIKKMLLWAKHPRIPLCNAKYKSKSTKCR